MVDQHINLSQSEIQRAAELIKSGGVVIIPTDTVYGLIGRAFDKSVFERMETIKGGRSLPYAVLFSSVDNLSEWYGDMSLLCRRIIVALHSSPTTFILPYSSSVPSGFRYREHGIGIRVISDSVVTQLFRHIHFPLWATSANPTGEGAPTAFRDVNRKLIESVDIALDGGETFYKAASTVIDLREQPFGILRRGADSDKISQELELMKKPYKVLVICTGNICRSPIAAYLIQKMIGSPKESGVHVSSAGTYASDMLPATQMMCEIGAEWGLDLSTHGSRRITAGMADDVDLILAMTPEHADYISQISPDNSHKVKLYGDTIGTATIPDPYANSGRVYSEVAQMIYDGAEGWAETISNHLLERRS